MFIKNVFKKCTGFTTWPRHPLNFVKKSAKSYSEKVGELQFTAIHRLSVDEILLGIKLVYYFRIDLQPKCVHNFVANFNVE